MYQDVATSVITNRNDKAIKKLSFPSIHHKPNHHTLIVLNTFRPPPPVTMTVPLI